MGDTESRVTWETLRNVVGAKWTCQIVRTLAAESYRFNALQREIDGLTATMLSRRLTELSCHGLVERTVEDGSPPGTRYELTPAGAEFAASLDDLASLLEVRDRETVARCCDDGDSAAESCVDAGGESVCLTFST